MEPTESNDPEKPETEDVAGGDVHALSEAKGGASSTATLPPDGNTGGNYSLDNPNPEGNEISINWNLQGEGRTKYRYIRLRPDEQQIIYRDFTPDQYAAPNIAGIDWLNLVFQFDDVTENSMLWLDAVLFKYIGYGLKEERPSGKFNYKRSWILQDCKTLFCVGGIHQNGTALISIPGDAIQFLDPLKLSDMGVFLKSRITRVDIYKDFFKGEYTIEQALADYETGRFRSRGAGRNPSKKFIESSSPDGNEGRTLYIGKRENGKVIRVYEKGLQMGLKKSEFSQWVRVEFEIHNTDRVIPWEILTKPGQYLAGSCEAMGFISGEQSRVKTITAKVGASFYKAVESARRQYGFLVNVMKDMGLSDQKVVSYLWREGFPGWYPEGNLRKNGISPGKVLMMVKEVFGEHLEWEET